MNLKVIRLKRDSEWNPLESPNETAISLEAQMSDNSPDPLNSMGTVTPTIPPDVVQWHQLFLQMPIAKVIAGIFAALAIANTAHHVFILMF